MGRSDLERLSREELIELVLRLQRPGKHSRTFSKPPATDCKERREQAKPGGAKPGHEGHSRVISADPAAGVEHGPHPAPRARCSSIGLTAAPPAAWPCTRPCLPRVSACSSGSSCRRLHRW